MLAKDYVVKVRNRSYGTVGYQIPELRIQRKFQKNETKELTMEELRKLSFQPGGQQLIDQFLVVEDKEALKELSPSYEPEYFYNEKDIERILTTASYEEFLDCLDFAPEGVIGLMKSKAVELEIHDIRKREAIQKKTGFNITRQIQINQESKIAEEEAEVKKRRVAIPEEQKEEIPAGRRTAAPTVTVAEAPSTPTIHDGNENAGATGSKYSIIK